MDIINDKRECGRVMHTYRAIWSKELFLAYTVYIESAFAMFCKSGSDAKIRTISNEKEKAAKERNGMWNSSFKNSITGERDPEHGVKYEKLIDYFIGDLQLDIDSNV